MQQYSQAKTLQDALGDIRRARKWIAAGVIAGFVCAAVFLLLAIPCYRAEMIVGPANSLAAAGSAAPVSADDQAVAHYIVQTADSPDIADFTQFENIYAGPAVAEILLKDENIAKGLSGDRALVVSPPQEEWSPEKLSEYVRRRVHIEAVGASPLRRLTYYHASPEFAAYFLNAVRNAADGRIREAAKNAAQKRIAYLQTALENTANPDHRRAMADILSGQERALMLVSIDQPFAAAIVEPAAASSKPQWPGRGMAFLSFMFAGALIGFVLHGFRTAA